jgi:hypothetical protein
MPKNSVFRLILQRVAFELTRRTQQKIFYSKTQWQRKIPFSKELLAICWAYYFLLEEFVAFVNTLLLVVVLPVPVVEGDVPVLDD